MRCSILAALLTASGCTTLVPIDQHQPPAADWPALTERVVYIEASSLPAQCGKAWPAIRGCSQISFELNTCRIYLADRTEELLVHERLHCKGFDHAGQENSLARAWERFKRIQLTKESR